MDYVLHFGDIDLGCVYTLEAARSRLRRGHRKVLLFWPGSGSLVRVTTKNIARLRREFKRQFG